MGIIPGRTCDIIDTQEVEASEGSKMVEAPLEVINTVQRRIQDLERLIGAPRRAQVIGRLSNTGSSQEGAVYSNRVDFYLKKVRLCTMKGRNTSVMYF